MGYPTRSFGFTYFPFNSRIRHGRGFICCLQTPSLHGMSLLGLFLPNSSNHARRQVWGSKSIPLLKARMSRSMRVRSGSMTYCAYVLIMDSKSGWSSILSTAESLNQSGLLLMWQRKEYWWIKWRMGPIIWLRRWYSITSNGPTNEANPSGLEASLKLMHLLTAKVDAMTQRLDRLNINAVNSSWESFCPIR